MTITDAQPSAPEPFEDDEANAIRLIEALLFASEHPLDEATIAGQLPEGADVAAYLTTLVGLYRNRGVNLVQVANGWAFRTAPDLAPHLKVHRTVMRKLSRAALETLSIIAYHQPATRAEIEDIRGVGLSRGTLDLLLEAGWIAPKGRRQVPGRPITWVTTVNFLEHFGLSALDDLPGIDELKAAGLLQSARPSIPGRAAQEGLPLDPDEEAARPTDEDVDPDFLPGNHAEPSDDTPDSLNEDRGVVLVDEAEHQTMDQAQAGPAFSPENGT